MHARPFQIIALLVGACAAGTGLVPAPRILAADGMRVIDLDVGQAAGAAAVVVDDGPLVHTTQLMSVPDGSSAAAGLGAQVADVVGQLTRVLAGFDSGLDRVVRLHVCVPDAAAGAETLERLLAAFPAGHRPACTCVIGPLPYAASLVAVDAVATTARKSGDRVTGDGTGRILPPGTKIYVSGLAEGGATLAEATRNTLVDIVETLAFLERSPADIVQYKAFLTPMADAAEVRREVARFHADGPAVPLVMVEWRSSPDKPIEIEAVAWGGPAAAPERLEYLTPTGKTASPLFARVVRVATPRMLYVGGLGAEVPLTTTGQAAAEAEVGGVYAGLKRALEAGGSDLNHLVKATYYVSTDAASVALNTLRPRYYDPARPPAASKAPVAGVGPPGRGLLLDMIAVPAATGR